MNLETIRRSTIRTLGFPIRPSSYPLISGDTYRAFCDVNLEEVYKRINSFMDEYFSVKLNVFIGVNLIQEAAFKIITSSIKQFNWNIFVHNGDLEAIPSYFEELSRKVKFIHSVNWLGINPKISAIPQGLENKSYLRNGVPADYLIRNASYLPWHLRKNIIYASFNENTNLDQRRNLLDSFSKNHEIYVDRRFQLPSEYRKKVMNSKFVISPPGNGCDCHRTWESIYLGAVPIVLRNFWPFNSADLPVLIIDDWADLRESVDNFSLEINTPMQNREQLRYLFLDKIFGI